MQPLTTPAPQASSPAPAYPGIPVVIHGNGAVAHVMSHVCGGVIGYPITPSTEISELYEAARAEGRLNVWGRLPFFFEPEGEHSAQSGALGAALTGGAYISNASSSQGILYAMESHYVTVGKKVGGFVLQVAARVVSRHSLNVMAGHDDVYALLGSGYTVLFGANPQEAADLAAISYRVSSLSLIPVANAMDGFSTSHMLCEARLPEPELLRDYLGDPAGRIPCPTVAQELLFGAKGRVFELTGWLDRNAGDIPAADAAALRAYLEANADAVEADNAGERIGATSPWVPPELRGRWRRQWLGAHEKGTRQLVPALVDPDNPGLTGPVQNQPDFQAGSVDHRTHFAAAVPALVRRAMDEYAQLTGRQYDPVMTYGCEDADYVMVALGSVCDDVRAVLPYLRAQGLKAGLVSIKCLQPFPEAEVAAALRRARAVMVLERSDATTLTSLVTQALFHAHENATVPRHPGVPPITQLPVVTTAIFGLGGHDLQPRHLVAAFENLASGAPAPLVYLGSQFFDEHPAPGLAGLQERLRAAYPETQLMALPAGENPRLLPEEAMRIRFHSVGGYGTIATGKLVTDILAGVLGMRSKSAPKYGSEKSGAPTNYYITLSPEPVLVTNAELEDVEIVICPDHKAFVHANPLKGLVEGGTLMLQSSSSPEQAWRELPAGARRTIRSRNIRLFLIDAFAVAKDHAPTPDLEIRMMGIAFIGALVAHVDRVAAGASREEILAKVRAQIEKKFGRKGKAVVEANMAVIADGIAATREVDHAVIESSGSTGSPAAVTAAPSVELSAAMCPASTSPRTSGLFDPEYYEQVTARPFREGTIAEAPVLPGAGLFMPAGTAAYKDKGLFRRTVPVFDPSSCTGCLECALVCPDAAIPNSVHEIRDVLLAAADGIGDDAITPAQRERLRQIAYEVAERVREAYRATKGPLALADLVRDAVAGMGEGNPSLERNLADLAGAVAAFPVARTRPFFDSPESAAPGTGALFSATIDPWKCTGCLECAEVCGPGALTATEQSQDVLGDLQRRFATLSRTPNTPARFLAGSDEIDGDVKRLLLDRENFYATTGGHGGCRGCGEVTALRLVMSASHALGTRRRRESARVLDAVATAATAKLAGLTAAAGDDPGAAARAGRLRDALAILDHRLYLLESGPTGNGPASTVVANSTGCSSVYASTMPFNNYLDPWVNSLFQDAQPLAKGIFEGLGAHLLEAVRAWRTAQLEIGDAYDPAVHDAQLSRLSWDDLTTAEKALMPAVLTVGGDGASYDIGFGAMSRILSGTTPLKVLVLNSGVYSNTGGQASTSSYTGQDSDLARVGASGDGKRETRKELGILAAFHPHVFVASTSTAFQAHFLRTTMRMLAFGDGPAVMDAYTPCGSEHGIPESASAARARLAVESRMSPMYVHDPSAGESVCERFSLEGNPDIGADWTTQDLEYVTDAGEPAIETTTLTPAAFALGETRFRKHFRTLDEAALLAAGKRAVPVEEYIDLPSAQRDGAVPFVLATDAARHLIKVGCSATITGLVAERRRHWRLLQFLAGVDRDRDNDRFAAQLADLQARYDQAVQERESSWDELAAAMTELASATPARSARRAAPGRPPAPAAAAAPAAAGQAGDAGQDGAAPPVPEGRPVWLDPADQAKCNDCATCYDELPMFFEKTKKIIDGQVRTVAQLKPGSLESVTLTAETLTRIERVRANCDAEIIR